MCLHKYLKPVGLVMEDASAHKTADDDLHQKLINYFVSNNRTKYAEITEAIQTGDIKLAHRLAHTLKSNAAQLRKKPLEYAAQVVESGLKKNGEYVKAVSTEQLKTLNMELTAVLEELEPMVTVLEMPASATAMDTVDALRLLDELEPVLWDSDVQCLSYIGKLTEIQGSVALIQHIDNLNFVLALKAFEELKANLESSGGL
jgi:HPt (histidine-containing phosphotransfer) domain-containing protein